MLSAECEKIQLKNNSFQAHGGENVPLLTVFSQGLLKHPFPFNSVLLCP